MALEVKHDANKRKFLIDHGDKESALSYDLIDNKTIEFFSTYVPEEFRNNGVASKLATEGLNYATLNGMKVIPTCPYMKNFINEHTEYKDLVKQD